jgi:hypothetical protein
MIIASRRLTVGHGDDAKPVVVNIHAPARTEDESWQCRYTIEWPDETTDRTIYGFDSAQALVLALQMIGFDLHTSDYHAKGDLRWDGQRPGFGFPLHREYRDWLVGDDAKHL